MMLRHQMALSLAVAVTAALITVNGANAAVTAYNDEAAWMADVIALGLAPTTETFDGIVIPGMQPSGSPYMVNGDFSITVTGNEGSSDDAFIDAGEFHGEIFPATEHVSYEHIFNQPILAFGQNYDGAASGLGIRLASSEGVVDIFDDGGYSGFEDGFFGFIADNPISTVAVIGSDANGGTAVGEIYDALDASYAIVPEPATSTIVLLVLASVARLRRR